LAVWPANEERVFTWELKVVDDPQAERTIENIINIKIEGLGDWEQAERAVLLTVGESISFGNGIYWDLGGRRVGSGLLPPQVNEVTQYLVVWSLRDSTGDFDTVNIETSLPPDVSFESEVDVQDGVLDFDSDTRVLSWNITDFDDIILPLTASFIIELVPSEEYQGEVMTLLNPSILSAKGIEDVIVRTRMLKTSDVVAETSIPIGVVQ